MIVEGNVPIMFTTSSWIEPSEPTITLKRGKVEISIKNASAIVQRMDELFPINQRRGYSWSPKEVKEYDHEKNKAWVIAAKNWFKQEFYGTNEDDFNIVVSTPPADKYEKQTPPFEENRPPVSIPCPPVVEKTVNKNAYELRSDILKFSIETVDRTKTYKDLNEHIEDILTTANRFYDFVENKNRNKH